MTWPTRGPSELWRKEADGTEAREDFVPGPAVEGGTVEVPGVRSGVALSFACTQPCDVTPYAALEAAGVARGPRGVKPKPGGQDQKPEGQE